MDDDVKLSSEDKIRAKIADYRRSADLARRKAEQPHLPMVRDGFVRMAEGFEKLADELDPALKGREALRIMQMRTGDVSHAEGVRADQTGPREPEADPLFTMSVVPFPGRPGQHGWIVFQNGKRFDGSSSSYATKRQAQAAGETRMNQIILNWEKMADGREGDEQMSDHKKKMRKAVEKVQRQLLGDDDEKAKVTEKKSSTPEDSDDSMPSDAPGRSPAK